MSSRLRPLSGFALAAVLALAGGSVACNAILGLGNYVVGSTSDAGADSGIPGDGQASDQPDSSVTSPDDASVPPDGTLATDAASDGPASSDAPNCDADPLTFTDPMQCYACTPTTSAQFANACTNSTCVPFDDTRLTNLLPDGALPPVPPKDASSE